MDLSFADKTAFRAGAVLIAQRVGLRAWRPAETLATNPLTVAVKGGGAAVLFRYGAVVFFDVSPASAAAFVAEIRPQLGNPYPAPETEDVEVRVDPSMKEGMKGEVVYLEALSVEVVERNVRVAQRLGEQTVPQHVLGKDGAACAHEGDFRHFSSLLEIG